MRPYLLSTEIVVTPNTYSAREFAEHLAMRSTADTSYRVLPNGTIRFTLCAAVPTHAMPEAEAFAWAAEKLNAAAHHLETEAARLNELIAQHRIAQSLA